MSLKPRFSFDFNRIISLKSLLWIIGFCAFINMYAIQTVLPLIQMEFHTSKSETGLLVSMTLLAVALLSPFTGMISDRLGRKGIICFSMFFLAIPTALTAICYDMRLLMFLRFLQGITVPGIIVVTMAYIGEEIHITELPKVTASYVSGTVIGGFVGRFLTGHVTELTDSWRAAFIALAVVIVICAFITARFLPASRNFVSSTNIGHSFKTLSTHIHNAKLLTACAVGFCVLFSLVSCFTYISYLLVEPPFSLNAGDIANIFTVYLVGGAVTPLAGRLIYRYGSQRSLIFATLMSMAGILLTLMPSLTLVVIGMTVFASGVFICQSASISFIALNITQGRSLATGLYNLSYYCGGAIGSWLSGKANDFFQWPGTVGAIIVIQCMSISIAYFFWKTPKKQVSSEHKENTD